MLKLIASLLLCVSTVGAAPAVTPYTSAKLLVVLVIDQFRADTLMRYQERFLPARQANGKIGGFNALLARGAYYPFAEYDVLQCMTGPGHATVLTGARPYLHGIPNNYWYDADANKPVYCVSDPDSPVIGSGGQPGHTSLSPRNLRATTLGDELKNAGYLSRVVSVALKDRAAILMGGRRSDVTLWFDDANYQWVSSRFYFPSGHLPDWVETLNREIKPLKSEDFRWEAKGAGSSTTSPDNQMLANELNANIGTSFPHLAKTGTKPALKTPIGVELPFQAAERALSELKLGRGKSIDLLAMSLSSHDYVAHAYGPNSRELEETTLAEDRRLAQFLDRLSQSVPGGLDQVIFALTADHGGGHSSEWLASRRMEAGRISEDAVRQTLEKELTEAFGKIDGGYVGQVGDLNVFLRRPALLAKGRDLKAVIATAKRALLTLPGVLRVATEAEASADLPGILGEFFKNTFFSGRSGDLTIVPSPGFITQMDTASHLAGFASDRMVPLLIMGKGVKAGRYAQRAKVIDLAPTLAFLIGVTPPSFSEGRALSEALR